MALRLSTLAIAMATLAAAPAQAVTYVETFNEDNNTLLGAEQILAGDTQIIGYRGPDLFDDESIDFFKFDFLAQGLTLLLHLTIDQADIDAFKNAPTMDLYVDDGFGGAELLASPNLNSTGSFISFLVDISGPFYLGVSGASFDPDFEPLPFDTNLTYTVSIQAVPLPAAAWMLGSALAATGLMGRRRR